jgi:membrane-associated phospholipid phosphatase
LKDDSEIWIPAYAGMTETEGPVSCHVSFPTSDCRLPTPPSSYYSLSPTASISHSSYTLHPRIQVLMPPFHFDQHLTERIRAAGQSALPLWIFLASHGMWGFAIVALVLVAADRLPVWSIVLPIVLTHLLTLGLQQIIQRDRPPLALSKIVMWRRTPSFPSAHSAGSMACATAISAAALSLGPVGVALTLALVLLAVAIGVSRIVVGVHFLTDVLVGFLFGILVTGIFLSVL